MQRTTYLIIGAGVSGLSFAERLQSDDYLICEAEGEIGGYCRTVKRDGFVWDYSGHFFHFKDPATERHLVSRIGDENMVSVRKSTKIHWGESLIDFPFQKNIHQLPREEFLECLHDLFFKSEGEAGNFKEMLYAKFGRGIAEKFLIPYNEKLYATDLALLDVDAMGRFFPYARLDEIISNFKNPDNESYNGSFTYPKGGAIEYIKAIAQGVDPARISLNERVLELDLREKVARTNLRTIGFDYLVSSAPFDRLLQLAGLPPRPGLYSANQVLVFNIGFDAKGPQGVHWIYFPQRELSFYRVGFYDNILGSDRMSLYVELGFPSGTALDDEELERWRGRVLEDLRRCGIVTDQQPVAWHSVLMDPAYIHITRESVEAVARAKGVLAARGVFSIGRYGSWTYCSIEDNMNEARELADTMNVLETLPKRGGGDACRR